MVVSSHWDKQTGRLQDPQGKYCVRGWCCSCALWTPCRRTNLDLASVGPATHVCNVCRRAIRATALLNPIEFMPFFSLFSENCSGIQFSNSRSTSVFSQSFPIYVPKASSFFIGFVQETNHSCLRLILAKMHFKSL